MNNFPLPHTTPIGSFTTLHMLKLRLLRLLLGFGALAVIGTWAFEVWSGRINLIDRVAYPAMTLLFIGYFCATLLWPARLKALELLSFGTLALYIIINLQAIIFKLLPEIDIYTLATFAQWFPLVYTAAFIFLDTRQAIMISAVIYLSLLSPTLLIVAITGSQFWADTTNAVLMNMIFSHPVYVVVLLGIAQLKEHYVRVKAQADIMSVAASVDHLTGASNRRSISHVLQQSLQRAQDTGSAMAVMLLDIDNFKRINDGYGHDVGDQVLIDVAEFLRLQLRASDCFGRWGGEEFLVVVPDTRPGTVLLLAERLRAQIADRCQPQVGRVTISFGVALSAFGDTPTLLLKRADEALYRAKQRGRNRIEMQLEETLPR